MPPWKSSNSPFPSLKSSFHDPTTSPSKPRRSLPDLTFLRSRQRHRSLPHPSLTRQRKLRHLTDLDIRGVDFQQWQSQSSSSLTSFSTNSAPSLSQSPSKRESGAAARPASVQPLPLPLPDRPSAVKRDDSSLSSWLNVNPTALKRDESTQSPLQANVGHRPSPYPKEVSGIRDLDHFDGLDFPVEDGVAERPRLSSSSAHGRPSVGSSLDHGKESLQDSVEHIQSNFKLNVPSKGTPIGDFSSPKLSPQRMSTGDYFPSSVSYQGLQVWSAPELPAIDMMFFSQTSPEKFVIGPDHSGPHGLAGNSPSLKPKNRTGTSSPLRSRMSPESSPPWHGSNGTVTVHPLPLPPGPAMPVQPAQPAFVHQATVKSEASSMISQWQKGKHIGSGTFGNVFVATNRETGALCAMKEVYLIPDDPKSAESMQQLEQEIKVLSQLKHQNIVQYYGSEIVEDRFYIYLEYVHPGSINKYIHDHCGSMTESMVRNFTRHILSGLAYLHSKKTIHRDIKGANLLVDSFGVVKLADFGMAKHLSGRAAALSLRGSPYWMAPEVMQAMMQKDSGYDLAVDIWSLGCTIIEMFTGKPPWSEFEGAAAMFKVLRNESPPIPETLSAKGKNFLECCFKRNPADRPSAIKLLEHPFVKNSHHQEMRGCLEAISEMKLMDTESSSEQSSSMQTSSQDRKRKQSSNSETGQYYPETSKSTAVSRQSPRSTLKTVPCLSPSHQMIAHRGAALQMS